MTAFTDWLTAMLDADEAAARAATSGPWYDSAALVSSAPDVVADDGEHYNFGPGVMHASFEDDGQSNATHIARHDPARVLAEVAAKRAILALHQDDRSLGDYWEGLDDALRHLAAPYSSEPGFDPVWAVT